MKKVSNDNKIKLIQDFWNKIESNKAKPKFLRSVKVLNSGMLKKAIEEFNFKFINEIIYNLYCGDFYILRGEINKNYINLLKANLTNMSTKEESSFHKIKNGCPNYWRRINEKIAKKYSVFAIRDSYYFFRWNKEKFNIWKQFNPIWRNIKLLGGLHPFAYEKNIPSDIVVDRVQIVRYPENSGLIETHSHDPFNQRIIISVYMSEIKKDYLSGGTIFFKGRKKVYPESKIKVGDIGLFYATLKHSVEPIKLKENKRCNKNYNLGRWWAGLYSPESDVIKNRHTSKPVS